MIMISLLHQMHYYKGQYSKLKVLICTVYCVDHT